MKQKNRYIVAYYALKPRKGAHTHVKGWMNNENNLQWDETMKMTEGLSKRDEREAQVVLDVDNKKIIRNWKANDGENDYNKLYEYYDKSYRKYISDFMKASNKNRLDKPAD